MPMYSTASTPSGNPPPPPPPPPPQSQSKPPPPLQLPQPPPQPHAQQQQPHPHPTDHHSSQPPNGQYPPPEHQQWAPNPYGQHQHPPPHYPPSSAVPAHSNAYSTLPSSTTLPPLLPHYPGAGAGAIDPRADLHSPYRPPGPPPHSSMYPLHAEPQHPYPHQAQPAPRQRTAIACRYCRRRKIRCSGFETSHDGKCQNCTRFSQECIFTPVSAQQAFVPAHAAFGRGAPPQQLYGAYGQPLPATQPPEDPYVPRNGPQPYPSTPGGAPGPYPYVHVPPQELQNGTYTRKRPHDDPNTQTLPPPHRQDHDYRYPDPTALGPGPMSPAESQGSYHSHSNHAPQPYYTLPPSAVAPTQPTMAGRRPSPTDSTYGYEQGRASVSPHAQSGVGYGAPQDVLRPPSNAANSRTPPPSAPSIGQPARPAMSISSIVTNQYDSQSNAEGANAGAARHPADSHMLNKLK